MPIHEELAAWAAQHAGSDLDLDRDLERAGLEVLETEPTPLSIASLRQETRR
jgi:hypothetical protein